MPIHQHDLESMIREGIPDAQVTVEDLAGDGDHYAVYVVSKEFEGKNRVQQHDAAAATAARLGGV